MKETKLNSWLAQTFGKETEKTLEIKQLLMQNNAPAFQQSEPRQKPRQFEQSPPFRHSKQGNFRKPAPDERKKNRPGPSHGKVLRVIPLGGLDEVGKNMMVFEHGNDIVIVDMGFQFPEEEMLGIDYVIPDISYLMNKTQNIRGILITHGHLDHIGAIPYLLPKLGYPPVYGSRLSLGLVKERLREFKLEKNAKLHEIDPRQRLQLGGFNVDWFAVNHSIPDSYGVILRTAEGTLVHTGDFKFDFTPVYQHRTDFAKLAALGGENVMALFSDSTNAVKAGHTMSEKQIGETIDSIISEAEGRIIIAVFSSSLGRVQQIVNLARKYDRKVFLSGRSMNDTIEVAQNLGFIKVPPGQLNPLSKMGRARDEKSLILTTGAQGEPMSALARMGHGSHANIVIKPGDTIVLSSSPIPGNERAIYTVINNLTRLGARVIFSGTKNVHTSGHASAEDLKLMINLVRPKYLVPVHGELYMRQAHAEIGQGLGMPKSNTIILENGDVMEVKSGQSEKTREKVSANYIMIDGKGVGDVGEQMLSDRQVMAENGFLMVLYTVHADTKKLVRDPELISRGFVHMEEVPELVGEIVKVARKGFEEAIERMPNAKRGEIKRFIRSCIDRHVHRAIERTPLVIPVIVTV